MTTTELLARTQPNVTSLVVYHRRRERSSIKNGPYFHGDILINSESLKTAVEMKFNITCWFLNF